MRRALIVTLTELRTLRCLYCNQPLNQSAGYSQSAYSHPPGVGECHFVIELPTKEKR